MTLRGKTLLISVASLVSLLATLFLVSRIVLLARFSDLEEQGARKNVEQALSAISDSLSDLSEVAKDYAAWDLNYDFMSTRDPIFPRTNLPTVTNVTVNIRYIAILDLSGRLVWGRGLDLVRQVNTPFPRGLQDYFAAHSVLLAKPETRRGLAGVALLPEGPALIASSPILTTDGRGPARGTLILGRYLDANEVERLARRTHLNVSLRRPDDPGFEWARRALLRGTAVAVQPAGADSITGYAFLRDPLGEPSMILKVNMARPIYAQGRVSLEYLLTSLLLVGVVFGGVTLVLLETTVLSRLSRLSTKVHQIGARPDLPARVSVSGSDELASLAGAVNRMLDALQESQTKLKDILEHSSNLFFSHTPDHTFTYVSGQTRAFFDCEPADAPVKWTDLTTDNPTNAQGLARTLRAIETGTAQEPHELELMTKKGRRIWVEVREAPVVRDGRTVAIVGALTDITERKRAERLQSALYRIAHVTSSVDDMREFYGAVHEAMGELLYAENFSIVLCEPASRTLSLAYAVDETHPPSPSVPEKGLEEYVLRTAESLLASRAEVDELARAGAISSRGSFAHWLGVPLMRDKTCSGVLSVWSYSEDFRFTPDDKSLLTFVSQHVATAIERKRAQEQIKNLAYNDALTGLPNRALFNDRLSLALAQAHRQRQRVTVLFLDLDHFKLINDSLGHPMGDRLLQAVGRRLLSSGREGDTVARLGGDEFTLLVPGVSQAVDAAKVAEKILNVVRQPFKLDDHELFVTCSIGVSLYPDDGRDAETLVKNADASMYRSKEQGRDTYQLYTPAMNAAALERLNLENSLRKAISQGELTLYYQPLIRVGSAEVHGFEALIRWNHPERGLILPSEFVPLAEITGLIVPMGPFVLRKACAQAKAWQADGHPLSISVNLSARQLQQADLLEQVKTILEETRLEARFLDLEITESNAMQNDETTIPTLRQLKRLGVRISVDDFGIGYSSLSYLRRLPIDTIKIDQSFVRDITRDPDDATIVTAVIAMAHTLKLQVVAEGVETEEQMGFLVAHKCDLAQGNFFSPPVPAERSSEFLARHARL